MPRTIRTKLYRFSELSEAAQLHLIRSFLIKNEWVFSLANVEIAHARLEGMKAEYLADGTLYTS